MFSKNSKFDLVEKISRYCLVDWSEVTEVVQKSILETIKLDKFQSAPTSHTETLWIDWFPRISLSAFLDDAPSALTISCNAPSLVHLGYITSAISHSLLFGMRQIGQGYVDLAPRIVVAQVLAIARTISREPNDKWSQHSRFLIIQNCNQYVKYCKVQGGGTVVKGETLPATSSTDCWPQDLEVCCLIHLRMMLCQSWQVIWWFSSNLRLHKPQTANHHQHTSGIYPTNITPPFFVQLSWISRGRLLIQRYTPHAFFVLKEFNCVPSQYSEILMAMWSGCNLSCQGTWHWGWLSSQT